MDFYFAFFYKVFKEHEVIYLIIPAEAFQQVCYGIPSKLNNVRWIKSPDVSTLDLKDMFQSFESP